MNIITFIQPLIIYLLFTSKLQVSMDRDEILQNVFLKRVPDEMTDGICSFVVWNVDALEDFTLCQDEFTLRPADGRLKRNTFKWLAFVQYLHVTTGLPHASKAPRALLIQKQFMVGTALDFLRLPKHYKLGNVIFGEYEREETECEMTVDQVKMGGQCPFAFLEMPLQEIIPHPEYSRFGVGNSLVLVKLMRPLKSRYMVPICMPSLNERKKKKRNKFVFIIDYLSHVPNDFMLERMGKRTVKLYTHKECRRHRMKAKLSSEGVTHVLCSSGCGVRTGSPIVSHNAFGGFELIGVAASGSPCGARRHRSRLIKEPPLYIDVYPYRTWIMNVIMANELPEAFPTNYRRVADGSSMGVHGSGRRQHGMIPIRQGWRARTYVAGPMCFSVSKMGSSQYAVFYYETFEVNASPPAILQLYMKITAGIYITITCASISLPNRLIDPEFRGIPGFNISLKLLTNWFPYSYRYTLALIGRRSKRKEYKEYRKVGPIDMPGPRNISRPKTTTTTTTTEVPSSSDASG